MWPSIPTADWYEHLAPALVHTLWQAAVIAGLLYLALRLLPADSARGRYALAVAALGLVVVGWMVTWSWLGYEPPARSFGPRGTATSTQPTMVQVSPDVRREAQTFPSGSVVHENPKVVPALGRSWQQVLAWCWLAGVLVMSVRLLVLVQARREGPATECGDERIGGQIEALARMLGVTCRVRVAAVEHLISPAVYGIVYPTILLPLAVIGESSSDQLRFILAHELAHIRRYDYLVNLAQMAVEALLFFNPAVWWISRQIRIEREACCDALAVQATGDAAGYARTLVDWSARLREVGEPRAVAAFAEHGRPTQLGDRVRRLVLPDYRPALRVSPAGLAGLLLVCGLALAGLFKGTGVAVAVAAEIMSPQERIERIQTVEKVYAPEVPDATARFEISGVVKTEDGGPIGREVSVNSYWSQRRPRVSSSTQSTLGVESGRFRGKVGAGQLWVWAQQPGYAVTLVGPVEVSAAAPPAPFELVLARGFTAQLLIADPDGKPVAGANVRAQLSFPAGGSSRSHISLGEAESDAFGQCAIEHVAVPKDCEAQIYVTAAGFQQLTAHEVVLTADAVTTVKLSRARPATGTVVYADGQPAAGAQIELLEMTRHTPQSVHTFSGDPVALTVCDEAGRFTLDTLADGTSYKFLVRGKDGSCGLLSNVAAGNSELSVELPPPLVVRGKVLGIEKLGRRKRLSYRNEGQGQIGRVELNVRDGVGYFELTGLLATKLELWGGQGRWSFELSGIHDVVLDLNTPPPAAAKRKVIFELQVPSGSPAAGGSMVANSESAPIKEGRAEFEFSVPNTLWAQCDGVTGYWFPHQRVDVTAGEEPLVVTIALRPAGSIYGRLAWPADKDEPEVRYSVFEAARPAALLEGESFHYDSHVQSKGAERTFVVAALPLGGSYFVMARQGALVVLSPRLRVDEQTPVVECNFERPPTVDVRGTVRDENGQPVAGASIALDLNFNAAGQMTHSTSATAVGSQRDGRFALGRVGVDPRIAYSLVVRRDGFQPAWIRELPLSDEPLDIHMAAGHTLRGVVLGANGEPVSDARIVVTPADQLPQSATSDARGEFELNTLPAGEVAIAVVRGGGFHTTYERFQATTGGDERVELRLNDFGRE